MTLPRYALLVFVVLLTAGSAAYGQSSGPLQAIYDPAKNETTVYLSPKYIFVTTYRPEGFVPPDVGAWMSKPEAISMSVYFTTPGNRPTVPNMVVVNFDSRASGRFRFNEKRDFVVVADSETFEFGDLNVVKSVRDIASRGVRGAYYEEVVQKPISLDTYARIVAAKKVEITVGESKFRLSEKNLKILRSYVEKLKS